MESKVKVISKKCIIVTLYKKRWLRKGFKEKSYIWRGKYIAETGELVFNGHDTNEEAETVFRKYMKDNNMDFVKPI